METGKAAALRAERVTRVRSKAQQLGDARQREIADAVHAHFAARPHAFEQFAADIVRLMDPNVVGLHVTRASRDGGRDAAGKYRIGQPQNCVTVDFAGGGEVLHAVVGTTRQIREVGSRSLPPQLHMADDSQGGLDQFTQAFTPSGRRGRAHPSETNSFGDHRL